MPTFLVTAGIYGRRMRLSDQPGEGPRWKAKKTLFRTSERRVNRLLQVNTCMASDKP